MRTIAHKKQSPSENIDFAYEINVPATATEICEGWTPAVMLELAIKEFKVQCNARVMACLKAGMNPEDIRKLMLAHNPCSVYDKATGKNQLNALSAENAMQAKALRDNAASTYLMLSNAGLTDEQIAANPMFVEICERAGSTPSVIIQRALVG